LPKPVNSKLSEKEVLETFRKLMSDAVKVRLRSDVEWGISLSGGLDSTSIAFVAKDVLKHHNFTTFSVIAEKGTPEDESYFINLANDYLESKNIQINPLADFDKETFLSQIYQIGSPVGDTTFFAQYIIKRVIKENGITVLLSGQGGDEIMAGYHHHFFKYTTELMLKGRFIKSIREIRKWAALKGKSKKAVFKSAIEDAYLAKKTAYGWANFPYNFQKKIFGVTQLQEFLKLDMEMLQLPYFLQADDSFSMAYAVETRNPFLDYRLVDFVFQLPNHYKIRDGWQKWILREAINEMPDEIRYRTDKKGFSTPMKTWVETHNAMLAELGAICDEKYPQHKNKPLFKRAALGAWIHNFQ
jgi:asparagine synthase (glutamine-hydrolysing)